MIHSILKPFTLLISGLAFSQACFALQTFELSDNQSAIARISQKEATRITIDDGRIVNVTGNLQLDKNADGEIAIEKDEARGQIFVKPLQDKTKPINLFISTEKATYTLLLQPVDMPADTIMIREHPTKGSAVNIDKAGTRKAIIKRLMMAMATGLKSNDMDVNEVVRDIRLWQETRFILQQTYTNRTLIGEKYLLTNITDAPLVIEEQEFFKDGVMSVAIDNQHLSPGASTQVLIIKDRGHDDH